jgi:hypothetical protein
MRLRSTVLLSALFISASATVPALAADMSYQPQEYRRIDRVNLRLEKANAFDRVNELKKLQHRPVTSKCLLPGSDARLPCALRNQRRPVKKSNLRPLHFDENAKGTTENVPAEPPSRLPNVRVKTLRNI